MTKQKASSHLSALFALLVLLVIVLPASAACNDTGCCPEAAESGACQGCLVGGCEDREPGFVLLLSSWAVEPPRAVETLAAAESDPPRPVPSPAPVPLRPPGLETTVLLI